VNGLLTIDSVQPVLALLRTLKLRIDPQYRGECMRLGPHSAMRPVFSLVKRNGDVRSFHIQRVTADTLGRILKENVEESSAIVTDELNAYRKACEDFWSHETINHTKGEYARPGNVHTNTIEGFFGILKRGINGIYHHVGVHHLHRYLAEFDFRYNSRKISDGARTEMAVRGIEGKRLTYRDSSPTRRTASR
jgi:transposase-like protein